MLAITRILLAEDHQVAFYTGSAFRGRVEAAGARFFPLPPTRISIGRIRLHAFLAPRALRRS
jgi:UDP:flavonoid glycosyltransferase YjiC (YdhE family)